MCILLYGLSVLWFSFVFFGKWRGNFDELEYAVPGKWIKKRLLLFLLLRFKTRRVIWELLASLLVGVFEVICEHIVSPADHVVYGLLIYGII